MYLDHPGEFSWYLELILFTLSKARWKSMKRRKCMVLLNSQCFLKVAGEDCPG